MKVLFRAMFLSLVLVETGIGGENLNPLLVNQAPGTWLKLETRGDKRPGSIHNHAGVALDPEKSVMHFFIQHTQSGLK